LPPKNNKTTSRINIHSDPPGIERSRPGFRKILNIRYNFFA
jgi:hypothetical protein